MVNATLLTSLADLLVVLVIRDNRRVMYKFIDPYNIHYEAVKVTARYLTPAAVKRPVRVLS